VRNLLIQKDIGEKRANWITTLQEYDLDIKPTKIVKGQGLCKLVVQSVGDEAQEDALYQDQILFER
jgi:hypothetical protein